jgi:hypothetical protein
MHNSRFPICCGILAFCAMLAGCQKQRTFAPTFPVHGAVTLDAKLLPDGMISFISPESGDLQALPIKEGKYEGQVRAGKRRVEIRAYLPRSGPRKPLEPPPKNYLPARYNADTILTADVAEQGPNAFDFALSSR